MALEFNLWDLLVIQLIGSYGLTVLVLMGVIFFIMIYLGKMSRLTVMYYEILFLFTMSIAYGYKLFSIFIGLMILVWFYIEVSRTTAG
jgi:hypothetical protein